MLSQSPWVGNSRRYNAYPLRSRKNVHYPPQPTYVRAPRRGPVPGPIRNPINSYRTTCAASTISTKTNIAKKITGCPINNAKPIFNSPHIPRLGSNKKSLSMVDLSPVAIKPDVADLRSESTASLQSRLRKVELGNCEGEIGADLEIPICDGVDSGCGSGTGTARFLPDTNRAASLVCRALVVNAWRRRREDNSQLQETIQHLTQQVDHLRIQIVVLRRLLDTENGRVSRFMAEMQRVRLQFDDLTRDRNSLKVEKEKAIEDAKQLREEREEKNVATENLRNELFTVKTQLVALDGQITRDREKLLKLREDKKILLDKVTTNENLASAYLTRAETAEATVEDLRSRLSAQTTLLTAVKEQQQKSSQEFKIKSEETTKLQKQLQLTQEVGKSLSLRANNLENELSDRDAALRRLETAYNSQLSELNDLKDRLAQQSQEGSGWSSRVLQIAGSVVRAPRAIFRTLSFLSNPGSSVTS